MRHSRHHSLLSAAHVNTTDVPTHYPNLCQIAGIQAIEKSPKAKKNKTLPVEGSTRNEMACKKKCQFFFFFLI